MKKAYVEMEGKANPKVIVNGNVTVKSDPCEERRLGRRVPRRIV